VYQVLARKVPTCLANDIHIASESSARSLMSSSVRMCCVTRVQSRFGDRCFAAAGPRIWNNLPASLRDSDKEVSCTEFRRKTFMFQTDCNASWLLIIVPDKYSYLLTLQGGGQDGIMRVLYVVHYTNPPSMSRVLYCDTRHRWFFCTAHNSPQSQWHSVPPVDRVVLGRVQQLTGRIGRTIETA